MNTAVKANRDILTRLQVKSKVVNTAVSEHFEKEKGFSSTEKVLIPNIESRRRNLEHL